MAVPSTVKDAIKTTSPTELEARGIISRAKSGGYICLHCGNGGGHDGTGANFALKSGIWVHNCPRCGKFSGDNVNLFAVKYGLDARRDFVEICRRACDELGIAYVEDPYRNLVPTNNSTAVEKKFAPPQPTPAELERQKKIVELVRADIATAQKNLREIPAEYMRGLTLETLERHWCGYLPSWIHPVLRVDGRKAPPTPRLIIPSGDSYLAVLPAKFRSHSDKRYHKMHAGQLSTFALEVVNSATARVYIFEGELDAMSAEQSYFNRQFLQRSMTIFGAACAENTSTGKIIPATYIPECAFVAAIGAGRRGVVNEIDTRCKALGIKPLIVIMFDDDDAGRTNAPTRKIEFERLGYRASVKFLKGAENS